MEDATRFYLFFLLLLYLKSYFIFNKKQPIPRSIEMKVITEWKKILFQKKRRERERERNLSIRKED